jgi:hypothetical protein
VAGANRLLQVRCAVYNGTLGSGFGQCFKLLTTATRKRPLPPDLQFRGNLIAPLGPP